MIKAKELTQTAFLVGITVLLFLVHKYVPLLGLIGTIFCPVPLVVGARKINFQSVWWITGVSFLLILILAGPFSGVAFLLGFASIGIVIAWGVVREFSFEKIMILGVLVSFLSTAIFFYISYQIAPQKLSFKKVQQEFITMFQKVKKSLREGKNKMSPQEIARLDKQLDFMILKIKEIKYFLPTMFLWGALFTTYITYWAISLLAPKLKITFPPLPPFSHFYLRWYWFWGLLLGIGLNGFSQNFYLRKVGENLIYFYLFLYFLVGWAIIKFFVEKFRINSFLKSLIFVILFLFFQQFIFLLGLADHIFDFRNIREKKNDGNPKLYGKEEDFVEIN